jgi:hypothetical protein
MTFTPLQSISDTISEYNKEIELEKEKLKNPELSEEDILKIQILIGEKETLKLREVEKLKEVVANLPN